MNYGDVIEEIKRLLNRKLKKALQNKSDFASSEWSPERS